MERSNKTRVAVATLTVLLVASLLALGGTLVLGKFSGTADATATSSNSLISVGGSSSGQSSEVTSNANGEVTGTTISAGAASQTSTSSTSSTAAAKDAPTIELYAAQPLENVAFHVGNMLPGDAETKYFRVRVSYHDTVTVHFKAQVQPGYDKLAEVLKLRVCLVTTGETIYDGLMRDASQALAYQLTANGSTTDELLYEATAYLDTSVGNEYQNKDLAADFTWWVEGDEKGNLEPVPFTGDLFRALPWACMAAALICAMLLFALSRRARKGGEEDGAGRR